MDSMNLDRGYLFNGFGFGRGELGLVPRDKPGFVKGVMV